MAADDSVRVELAKNFKDAVKDHPDVMAECVSICRIFGVSPEDLKYKYEAFLMSRPSGLRSKLQVFTLDVARELRKEIQREAQAKSLQTTTPGEKVAGVRKKGAVADLGGFLDGLVTPVRKSKSKPSVPAHLSNTSNNANLPSPSFATPTRTPATSTPSAYRAGAGPSRLAPPSVTPMSKTANGSPSTPVSDNESPQLLAPTPSVPFRARPDPHALLETLNGHLATSKGVPGSRPRIILSATVDPKQWEYRYMFEKMSARSEALDEQIDEFGDIIKEAYGLADLGDPHLQSEDDIYTVGRILVPPTDGSKAKLNSVFLQSSRMLGAGRVVSLRWASQGLKVRGGAAGVRGFGLYPGALVCVKGRNGGGDAFVVDEVLMPPLAQLPASMPKELLEYQQSELLGGQPVSVYVAAGPYTLESDLLYEPLDALTQVAIDERPDVLILLGPFVDSAHPLIQSGKITVSPAELFREQIASKITRIQEASPGTSIILIPSVRDLVSRHAAYPQAMLEKEGLGLSKKVKVLPNPCTICVNEVVISLASTDVLFHLRREEVFQRAEEAEPDTSLPVNPNPQGDMLANAVRHVLGQRHFYPLFPAPEALSSDVNLDVTHWNMLKLGDTAPDVLILPSKLKHFSKIVDSTLAINPGFLSSARAAGTFAKLTIHPSKGLQVDDDDDMGEEVEHKIYERARSEVWRI